MGNDGIVISESEPTTSIGKFTWLQILPDGTRKWFERADGGWSLVKTEGAPASADHTHSTFEGDSVEASGKGEFGSLVVAEENGIDQEVTIEGTTLKFKGGILYEVG